MRQSFENPSKIESQIKIDQVIKDIRENGQSELKESKLSLDIKKHIEDI